jgi:hypothetical protein
MRTSILLTPVHGVGDVGIGQPFMKGAIMSHRALLVLAVLLAVVMVWGCKSSTPTRSGAVAVGAMSGTYQKLYPYTVQETYNAAMATLEADKVPVYSKQVGATMGAIRATLVDGKKLSMDFKATGVGSTLATINVGGDVGRTNYFYEQLDSRLQGTTSSASPMSRAPSTSAGAMSSSSCPPTNP